MITRLNELKAAFAEVKEIKEINISQIDHGTMGGLSNTFIVSGSAVFTKALIDYLKANEVDVLDAIKANVKSQIDTERIVAIAELEEQLKTEKSELITT